MVIAELTGLTEKEIIIDLTMLLSLSAYGSLHMVDAA